ISPMRRGLDAADHLHGDRAGRERETVGRSSTTGSAGRQLKVCLNALSDQIDVFVSPDIERGRLISRRFALDLTPCVLIKILEGDSSVGIHVGAALHALQ